MRSIVLGHTAGNMNTLLAVCSQQNRADSASLVKKCPDVNLHLGVRHRVHKSSQLDPVLERIQFTPPHVLFGNLSKKNVTPRRTVILCCINYSHAIYANVYQMAFFPSGFPMKSHNHFFSPIRATCATHLILPDERYQ